MKEIIKHVYYVNINGLGIKGLGINDEGVPKLIKDFKAKYLTELGDSVLVVPSTLKDGLEVIPQNC